MSPEYALFTSFLAAFLGTIVISFWAEKIGKEASCLGIIISAVITFAASYLFLVYAPDSLLVPVYMIAIGIVVFSLIVKMIKG